MWSTIATINVTQDWQFTPVIASNLGYARLSFGTAGIPLFVAEVDLVTGDYFDQRRIMATPYPQIFEFESPAVFANRAIALRLPIPATSFDVQIDVSDVPIFDGSGSGTTVNLQPLINGQAQILQELESIDVELDPQIAANIQSIVNSQTAQNTALGQLQNGQTQILQEFESIDVELDPQIAANIQSIVSSQTAQNTALGQLQNGQTQILQAIAALTPLNSEYYRTLALLNPVLILPLDDSDTNVRSYEGATVGAYSGNYQQSQPSLLSDMRLRATRFLNGRIATNQSYVNPYPYTLVIRARIAPTGFSGGFFHFGASTEFTNATFDRQFYVGTDGRLGLYNFSGGPQTITTPQAYNDGQIHTFVARANTQEYAIFVDGVKVVSTAVSGALNYTGFWKVAWLWRGDLNQESPANNITLQGAAIFHSSLSDAQILLIHQSV